VNLAFVPSRRRTLCVGHAGVAINGIDEEEATGCRYLEQIVDGDKAEGTTPVSLLMNTATVRRWRDMPRMIAAADDSSLDRSWKSAAVRPMPLSSGIEPASA